MTVYCISLPDDHIYVGSTNNLQRRVGEHMYRLRHPDKQVSSSNTKLYKHLRNMNISSPSD